MRAQMTTGIAMLAVVASCGGDPTVAPPSTKHGWMASVPIGLASQEACGGCTFGPRVYVRVGGKPTTEIHGFAADPEADYMIDIDDDGSQGADGSVVLNGEVLLSPRAGTDDASRHVRRPVVLAVDNTLEVRLTGKPGSHLRISILGGVAVIGLEGGVIRMPGGAAILTIPEGALDTSIEIAANVDRLTMIPPALQVTGRATGPAIRLAPEGLRFNLPVSVDMNYEALGQIAQADEVLGLVHYNEDGTAAEVVSSEAVSSFVRRTHIRHFSLIRWLAWKSYEGWSTYDLKWVSPVVRWYVSDANAPESFVTQTRVAEQFAKWQAASGIRFEPAASLADANIVVVEGGLNDGTSPSYAECRNLVVSDGLAGRACFSANASLNRWKVDLNSNDVVYVIIYSETIRGPSGRGDREDLATQTILHEIGHAIGINHTWVDNRDAVMVSGDVTRPFPVVWATELHAWDVAAARQHYGMPPTGCTWCNTTLTFDGNVLPAGWQQATYGPRPGQIANGRLEAFATDRGLIFRADGAPPSTATSVEIVTEGPTADVFFGMFNGVQLETGSRAWRVTVNAYTCTPAAGCGLPVGQSNQLVFGVDRLDNYAFPNSSTGPGSLSRVAAAYQSGTVLRIRRIFRDESVEFIVTRLSDAAPVATQTLPLPGFRVASVSGAGFYLYFTSSSPLSVAWVDNVAFTVQD